jgi:catechol 2,3-dioxygenase-like lactoylglutathione lyase family enzyme
MADIRYMVADVETSIQFYTDLLGFVVQDRWGPAFAIVAKGDLSLWLSGPETSAARPMPDGRQPEPGGWNRIVVEVDDIEATVATMREKGIRFRNDIISGPGGKQILAEDPSGNPIEVFQPA